MKPQTKKLLCAAVAILTTLSMTLSMSINAGAETLMDRALYGSQTIEQDYAILDYDEKSDSYELIDRNGNPVLFDMGVAFKEEKTEAIDPTEALSDETNTTLKSDPTPVTAPPPPEYEANEKTTTVTKEWYIAKYRDEVMSSLAAVTTTTTTTTTKKPTTTTTKKPATTAPYKGIDVSRHQGTIDWTKVKNAGINFVMIRAGYGNNIEQEDANFKTNIAGAQKVGIECGVYWYSYALTTADALREAQACYDTIKGYKLSYPVAFDIEDPSQSSSLTTTQISNIVKTFCEYLENKRYYVCVYSYASMLTNQMNASVKTNYDIWVAHINADKPSYSGNYGMWQYSHTGRVNGISTDVDLDYSYKNYPDIIKKNKLNGYT